VIKERRDTLRAHGKLRVSALVRYLPLIFLLLVACEAPPTQDQVTTRAVKRNCEAQGNAAATEVRKQSAQVVKEGGVTNVDNKASIEAKALKAEREAFKVCMLRYAV
jgi:hypothetical protein